MWYTLGKLTHSYRLTFNYVHIIHIMLQIYTTRLHSKHNQMCRDVLDIPISLPADTDRDRMQLLIS